MIGRQFDELRRIEAEGYSPSGVLAPFHDALVPAFAASASADSRPRWATSTSASPSYSPPRHTLKPGAHSIFPGTLPVLAREFITQRINQLIRGEAAPDHLYEREQLLGAFGDEVAATTRVDLFVRTHRGDTHYFEIKSPKPNRGQCIEMKQRQLTALALQRDANTFAWWGVPYDPYGRADAYSHPHPRRFFDFSNEVKMGADFWNFVGDSPATHESLIGLYRDVGLEYRSELDELRAALADAAG